MCSCLKLEVFTPDLRAYRMRASLKQYCFSPKPPSLNQRLYHPHESLPFLLGNPAPLGEDEVGDFGELGSGRSG